MLLRNRAMGDKYGPFQQLGHGGERPKLQELPVGFGESTAVPSRCAVVCRFCGSLSLSQLESTSQWTRRDLYPNGFVYALSLKS